MVEYECTDGSDQLTTPPIMRYGEYVGAMEHDVHLRHYLAVVQAEAHQWAKDGSTALQWLEACTELEEAIVDAQYPF